MSMRLVSGGSYNVRASELCHDRPVPKTVPCIVQFLDDTKEAFEVDKKSKAQILLDRVFSHLELVEKDYFGLQFSDSAEISSDMMRWLDPMKTLKKQIRAPPPYHFFFRVKFYVCDPCKLTEEYTRYHFFLQLKKDILEGRLVCPESTVAVLAGYAIQSDLGDYNPDEHPDSYLSDFCLVPKQSLEFERLAAQCHRQNRGQTPCDAEYNFLEKAKSLDMYGVDIHSARDQTNTDIQLGVSANGLVVFQNNAKINTFSWSKIVKISFKRKQFFIQLRRDSNEGIENLIGFNMVSYRCCKNLWKSCVEHHTFFRLHSPNPPSKKIFGIGTRFRYSGRTEFQTIEESKRRAKIDRSFSRSPSKRYARRTIGGSTSAAIMEERNFAHKPYRQSLPKSSSFSNAQTNGHLITPYDPLKRYDISRSPHSFRSTLPSDFDRKNTWSSHHSTVSKGENDSGFTINPYMRLPNPATGTMCNGPSSIYDIPAYDDQSMFGSNGYCEGSGLVTIKMQPDNQGRYGFNVKGGCDQGMPVIVSRVAANSPADTCFPRLNEGDQVLYINGRDISQHTHEQVVMFIRASREAHTGGELTLIVRPNDSVYVTEEQCTEPDLTYIPETHQISSSSCADALEASMMLLQEALENGAAMAQFEQLYRKKPGLSITAARLQENIIKNRYRDISPYDKTRVILSNCSNGDYINANYVNMEIPGLGIVNRYIAAQGPLPNTTIDFWQMVWEQQSSLVVMLTAKYERGRPKCHQYWPDLYETTDFGSLQITCVKEEETTSFAFRDFTLSHVETNEERQIVHMQYIAWPDHGVPDDPSDFLDFVLKVRQNRVGMVEPTVVHCSAGIGRTGVIITMETAMCLIEANQPVYPQSIVRQMRDQRAMLIQTASQYKFVCEAIIRVYNEQLVKPLNYHR